MVISEEDALFKTRPNLKVNVQLPGISLFLKSSWILFLKSSWIKTTAIGLSYELAVNGEKKKLMETGILLIKMGIAHFTPVNLEILTI